VIFENCKPILGEKIRYHREKVFKDRLRRAPAVPRMNMDLHLAKAQQWIRYADDELPANQVLTLDDLAQDFSDLTVPGATGSKAEWDACIEGFLDRTLVPTADGPAGGAIEPVGEERATFHADIESPEALEPDHLTTEH
jgi:type IV secretion system protein VirD4